MDEIHNGGNRSLADRLISPHGFDGRGPIPQEVTDAAKRIARLRVKFLTRQDGLTTEEVDSLFDAAAIQAEWMRELFDAVGAGGTGEPC